MSPMEVNLKFGPRKVQETWYNQILRRSVLGDSACPCASQGAPAPTKIYPVLQVWLHHLVYGDYSRDPCTEPYPYHPNGDFGV